MALPDFFLYSKQRNKNTPSNPATQEFCRPMTHQPSTGDFKKQALSLAVANALLLTAASAQAATMTVLTNAGDTGNNASCSLREAIENANTNTQTHADCPAGETSGDVIEFDGVLSGSTISLGGTPLDVTVTSGDYLTIDGDIDDDGSPDITISGGNASRVMNIYSTYIATLEGLTISNGSSSGNSGGIDVTGSTVIINDSVFTNNTADSFGGVLYIRDTSNVTIQGTTFSSNSAGRYGGAIDSYVSSVSIDDSTFSNNSSGRDGGAIDVYGSYLTITNSTFSENSADYGGAFSILNYGSLTLTNSTISGNTAASFGNSVYMGNPSTLTIENSIIANSSGAYNCSRAPNTYLYAYSDSIIEDNNCNLPGDIDPARDVDPKLGELADNGGPTQTHLIASDSPAIDTADFSSCPSDDQRGETRNADLDSTCDVGAVERQSGDPEVVTNSGSSGGGGGSTGLWFLLAGLAVPIRRWLKS